MQFAERVKAVIASVVRLRRNDEFQCRIWTSKEIERAAGCPEIEFDGQSLKVVKIFYLGDTICAREVQLTAF